MKTKTLVEAAQRWLNEGEVIKEANLMLGHFLSYAGDLEVGIIENNLIIKSAASDSEWKEFLAECEDKKEKVTDENFFIDTILDGPMGGLLGNGFSIVAPEDIGALTDSLILEYDGKYFWYPQYQVESYIEPFIKNKQISFEMSKEDIEEDFMKGTVRTYDVPNTNLTVVGFGRDVNGNATIRVATPNERVRSLQIGDVFQGKTVRNEYWKTEKPETIEKINRDLIDYVERFEKGIRLKKMTESVIEESVEEVFDIKRLIEKCQECYDEVVKNFDMYSFEKDLAQYRIETLGSGAAGIHQAEEIIAAYEIPLDKNDDTVTDEEYIEEFGWEIVEEFFSKIRDEIVEKVKLQTKEGYEDYNFWFGNDENDADFCLFIGVDRNLENIEESSVALKGYKTKDKSAHIAWEKGEGYVVTFSDPNEGGSRRKSYADKKSATSAAKRFVGFEAEEIKESVTEDKSDWTITVHKNSGEKVESYDVKDKTEEEVKQEAKNKIKGNKEIRATVKKIEKEIKEEGTFFDRAKKFLGEDAENGEDDFEAEQEFIEDEPNEEDCFITDVVRGGYDVSCGGKFVGHFREYDDAVIAIGDWQKKHNFWPNVFSVSDHGNMNLIIGFQKDYEKAKEDKLKI